MRLMRKLRTDWLTNWKNHRLKDVSRRLVKKSEGAMHTLAVVSLRGPFSLVERGSSSHAHHDDHSTGWQHFSRRLGTVQAGTQTRSKHRLHGNTLLLPIYPKNVSSFLQFSSSLLSHHSLLLSFVLLFSPHSECPHLIFVVWHVLIFYC